MRLTRFFRFCFFAQCAPLRHRRTFAGTTVLRCGSLTISGSGILRFYGRGRHRVEVDRDVIISDSASLLFQLAYQSPDIVEFAVGGDFTFAGQHMKGSRWKVSAENIQIDSDIVGLNYGYASVSSRKSGSHGGVGTRRSYSAYGSSVWPSSVGQGSYTASAPGGAGSLQLWARDTLTLNAVLRYQSQSNTHKGEGASPGSVLVVAPTLRGSGSIYVMATFRAHDESAPGGGRAAIHYVTDLSTWTVKSFAPVSGGHTVCAGVGTYLRRRYDAFPDGLPADAYIAHSEMHFEWPGTSEAVYINSASTTCDTLNYPTTVDEHDVIDDVYLSVGGARGNVELRGLQMNSLMVRRIHMSGPLTWQDRVQKKWGETEFFGGSRYPLSSPSAIYLPATATYDTDVVSGSYLGGWTFSGNVQRGYSYTFPIIAQCRFVGGVVAHAQGADPRNEVWTDATTTSGAGTGTQSFRCPVPPGRIGSTWKVFIRPSISSTELWAPAGLPTDVVLTLRAQSQCDAAGTATDQAAAREACEATTGGLGLLHDGSCDDECNNLICSFDGRDCPSAPVFVAPSDSSLGNDTTPTGAPDEPFATVQAALDAACFGFFDCSPVFLLPGTHEADASAISLENAAASVSGVPGRRDDTVLLVRPVGAGCGISALNSILSLSHLTLRGAVAEAGSACDHAGEAPMIDARFADVSLVNVTVDASKGPSIIAASSSRVNITNATVMEGSVSVSVSSAAAAAFCHECVSSIGTCPLCTRDGAGDARREGIAVRESSFLSDGTTASKPALALSVEDADLGDAFNLVVSVAHTVVSGYQSNNAAVDISATATAAQTLDVEFDDVRMTDCRVSSGSGGAVAIVAAGVDSVSVSVADSEFIRSRADAEAGAVFVQLASQSDAAVTVSDTHFEMNTAGTSGGALVVTSGDGEALSGVQLTVVRCTFASNVASDKGGALVVRGASEAQPVTLFARNLTFTGGVVNAGGGAMYTKFMQGAVTDSTFEGNTGGSAGGDLMSDDSMLALVRCETSGSSAAFGSSVAAQSSSVVTLSYCTLGDSSGFVGGVLNVDGGARVTVDDTLLHSGSGENGGCVRVSGRSHLTMRRSNVTGCVATERGGALYASHASTVVVEHSRFSSNRAAAGAGIVLSHAAVGTISSSHLVDNSQLATPETLSSASAVLCEDASLTIGDGMYTEDNVPYAFGCSACAVSLRSDTAVTCPTALPEVEAAAIGSGEDEAFPAVGGTEFEVATVGVAGVAPLLIDRQQAPVSVYVNGRAATDVAMVEADSNRFVSLTPRGVGSAVPVRAFFEGRPSPLLNGPVTLTYDAPVVASVSPEPLPAAGGTITIAGTNFGEGGAGGDTMPVVRVQQSGSSTETACESVAFVGSGALQCSIAAYSGTVIVHVDVAGQTGSLGDLEQSSGLRLAWWDALGDEVLPLGPTLVTLPSAAAGGSSALFEVEFAVVTVAQVDDEPDRGSFYDGTECEARLAAAAPAGSALRGALTTNLVGGVGAFTGIGVVGEFDAVVPIEVVCTTNRGEVLGPASISVALAGVRAEWSPETPQRYAAHASTVVLVEQLHPAPRLVVRGLADVVEAGVLATDVPCTVTATRLDDALDGDEEVSALGDVDVVVKNGELTASGIGVTGPPGAQAALTASCTWVDGASIVTPPILCDLRALVLEWEQSPPPLALPSDPAALSAPGFVPAPSVVVREPDALGGVVVGDSETTCTVVGDLVESTAAGAELSVFGRTTAAIDATSAVASFDRLRVAVSPGSLVSWQVLCTRRTGQSIGPVESTTRLQQLSVRWTDDATAPPEWAVANVATQPLSVTIVDELGEVFAGAQPADVSCTLSLTVSGSGERAGNAIEHGSSTRMATSSLAPPRSAASRWAARRRRPWPSRSRWRARFAAPTTCRCSPPTSKWCPLLRAG